MAKAEGMAKSGSGGEAPKWVQAQGAVRGVTCKSMGQGKTLLSGMKVVVRFKSGK